MVHDKNSVLCLDKVYHYSLYQHENTVRYRISRIFDILGIDDDEDRYAQLAIYGKLYRIYENSEDERMI